MKVAVVVGGPSTEAEVSRASGRSVVRALEQGGHEVKSFELAAALPGELQAFQPQVVYPAVHGAQGEDGCLQGLLEVGGYPYVGSGVRASAVAADKAASKVWFRASGLSIARDKLLDRSALSGSSASLLRDLREELGGALIVKPSGGGSTIGISRLLEGAEADDLERALHLALSLDPTVLVEEYLRGPEVTCAVLELDDTLRALPVTLIQSEASDWYDFESKYKQGGSKHTCPAPFDAALTASIQDLSLSVHRVLGLRDVSRSDFIVTKERGPVLLEVNTIPGMTDTSLLPEAALAAGISFAELLDSLVRQAFARGARVGPSGVALPGS